LASRTGRTRSVQAYRNHVGYCNAGAFRGNLETIRNLAETDLGSLLGKGRMLAQALDQKSFLLVHQRIVDGRSAKIHTGHDWHADSPLFFDVLLGPA
jgi:hypothetical protein